MILLDNLNSFQANPNRPLILGLGNFDGLHSGHQTLLQYVVEKAHVAKGQPAVLTFQEHPQLILHPDKKPSLLTPGDYKMFLMKEFGIEACFWLHFTKAFSQLSPEDFVKNWLVKKLGVREICLGYNAHFGHERKGDANLMRKLSSKYGFKFEEINPVMIQDDFVSSTRIRALIQKGDLDQASACLGRPWGFLSSVVKGAGRGRSLGYPTANLGTVCDVMPPHGVYTASVRVLNLKKKSINKGGQEELMIQEKGPWMKGVLNFGVRPTFKGQSGPSKEIVEVHILGFKKDLYGQDLEVAFHTFIRPETAFSSPEALKNQLDQDVKSAEIYFKSAPKKSFTKVID